MRPPKPDPRIIDVTSHVADDTEREAIETYVRNEVSEHLALFQKETPSRELAVSCLRLSALFNELADSEDAAKPKEPQVLMARVGHG